MAKNNHVSNWDIEHELIFDMALKSQTFDQVEKETCTLTFSDFVDFCY